MPERLRRWKNTAVGTKAKKMYLRSRGWMMYGQKLLLCATKNEACRMQADEEKKGGIFASFQLFPPCSRSIGSR